LFHLGLRLRTSHCCLKLAWSASRHAVKSLDIFEPALLFLPPCRRKLRDDALTELRAASPAVGRFCGKTSASSWRPSFVSPNLLCPR